MPTLAAIPRIQSAEAVIHGVLKIVWNDGYSGVVDLRPVFSKGQIFTFVDLPENFPRLLIGEAGSSVYWTDEEGHTIDFGTRSLRERAESQAELIRLAG